MPAPASSRPLALVTGASGGIGAALAVRFARGGYDLALVARTVAGMEETRAAARKAAPAATVRMFDLDLTRPEAGEELEQAFRASGLSPAAVVNNAGYGLVGDFAKLDRDEQLQMIDLNCRALTELCRRFAPDVVSNRGGVLNVASTAAFQPGPGMAVYYATKAYVLSFTEALDHELRRSGAFATCLCPGPVETGFQARARFHAGMAMLRAARMKTAAQVADAGFEGFEQRRPVVIPGWRNALVARLVGFVPRRRLLRAVASLQTPPA